MNKSSIFNRKKLVVPAVCVSFAITAGILFALGAPGNASGANPLISSTESGTADKKENSISKAILSVENMSCSGCVSTIKSSLKGIEGIQNILVDVAGGKAEVYYDSAVLSDLSRIEKAITGGGYPAKVVRVVPAEELRRETDDAAAKSQALIASVNGKDIPRADFDAEMTVVKKNYAKTYGAEIDDARGHALMLDRLKAQAAVGLVNEGIMLVAADKSGVRLGAGEMDAAFETFVRKNGKTLPEMKATLKEAGYAYDMFMRRFESQVLINKFLGEKILAGVEDPDEKQRVLTTWFRDMEGSADIIYYDKEIERLIKNRSGSSSGCSAK